MTGSWLIEKSIYLINQKGSIYYTFFYPQTLTTYCCPTFFYTRFTRVLNGLAAEPRTSLLCFTLINLCEVVVPGEEWVSDQSRQHPKSASPFIPTSPACLNRVCGPCNHAYCTCNRISVNTFFYNYWKRKGKIFYPYVVVYKHLI